MESNESTQKTLENPNPFPFQKGEKKQPSGYVKIAIENHHL